MTTLAVLPFISSTALLAVALLGVRPMPLVPALVAVTAACWWCA